MSKHVVPAVSIALALGVALGVALSDWGLGLVIGGLLGYGWYLGQDHRPAPRHALDREAEVGRELPRRREIAG